MVFDVLPLPRETKAEEKTGKKNIGMRLTLKVMLSANSVSHESGVWLYPFVPYGSTILDQPVMGKIHRRLSAQAAAIMKKARLLVRLRRYLSGDVIDQ